MTPVGYPKHRRRADREEIAARQSQPSDEARQRAREAIAAYIAANPNGALRTSENRVS